MGCLCFAHFLYTAGVFTCLVYACSQNLLYTSVDGNRWGGLWEFCSTVTFPYNATRVDCKYFGDSGWHGFYKYSFMCSCIVSGIVVLLSPCMCWGEDDTFSDYSLKWELGTTAATVLCSFSGGGAFITAHQDDLLGPAAFVGITGAVLSAVKFLCLFFAACVICCKKCKCPKKPEPDEDWLDFFEYSPILDPSYFPALYSSTLGMTPVINHELTVTNHELTVKNHELTVRNHELTVRNHELTVTNHELTVNHELLQRLRQLLEGEGQIPLEVEDEDTLPHR